MKRSTIEKNHSMGLLGANASAEPTVREHNAVVSETSTRYAPVRILVADRSEHSRRRIREMFAYERDFKVVGEAALPQDLTEACAMFSPDIVILGLEAYGDEPFAWSALAGLKQAFYATTLVGAIVLVSSDAPEEFLESLRAGAKGVLLRDMSNRTLLDAVDDVMAGGAALDRRLTDMVFEYLASHAGPGARDTPWPMDPIVRQTLSPREQDVLYSLAQGLRNYEIAARLGVSVGTVKTHLRHIYRKLEVSDRISAVLKAFQLCLPEAA